MPSVHTKALLIAVVPILVLVLIGVVIFSRSKGLQRIIDPSLKLQVVATIYPLADIAKQVGGDLVEVTTLVPAGVEPHDYEPTPQEIAKLYSADVAIVHGKGIDPWAEKLIDDLRKKGVRVVRTTDDGELLGDDPHVWLDPVAAKQLANSISWPLFLERREDEQLQTQLRAFEARLDALDAEYKTKLSTCKQREFVTSHDAFAYLAKRYNLIQRPISGLSPTEDPSPQTMSEISQLVQQKGITTIFTETLVSPKTAQTIASETGAKTAVLNPIEGITEEEQRAGKEYIQLMEDNLVHLRAALQCP